MGSQSMISWEYLSFLGSEHLKLPLIWGGGGVGRGGRKPVAFHVTGPFIFIFSTLKHKPLSAVMWVLVTGCHLKIWRDSDLSIQSQLLITSQARRREIWSALKITRFLLLSNFYFIFQALSCKVFDESKTKTFWPGERPMKLLCHDLVWRETVFSGQSCDKFCVDSAFG